jgi:benzylsuccinate CoA-transferase BbsF subunit
MRSPAYATLAGRQHDVGEVEHRLAQETKRCTPLELVDRLQHHGVAAAVVETSAEVADDPQLWARRYWEHVDHLEMGSVLVNKPPFRTVGEERCVPGPPPLLGQHTVELAATLLGFDEAECRRLIEEKVFY